MLTNPLADDPAGDADDQTLVRRAQAGDRAALEQLVDRHQPWIYNIVRRMTYSPDDAEDATQELLIKLLTKLSTFEGRSSFRTWFYRIVVNHVLTMRKRNAEEWPLTFESYGEGLASSGDAEPPDPNQVPVDVQLLEDEARIGCTTGMLLCLDREQRLVYILGGILGVTDVVGAELLEISRENFRQKLARARRDLHQFMTGQCGLVDPANPCRCARKMRGFIKVGYLDPQRLIFARDRIVAVRQVAPKALDTLESLDDACAEVYRAHPFLDAPDLVGSLRTLLALPDLKSLLAVLLIVAAAISAACRRPPAEDVAATVVAMERQALDRWGHGDPQGYFDIMAPEITYFDPTTERRVDSRAALERHIRPFTGKIAVARFEMLNPSVQVQGDTAILSFNLISHVPGPGDPTVRWNSTEVYHRRPEGWRIIHNHWSYLKPELKATLPNEGM